MQTRIRVSRWKRKEGIGVAKSGILRAGVVLVGGLALFLAGCDVIEGFVGDDEKVEAKIGVVAPFSGDSAADGLGIKNGAQLAIEQANESEELRDLGITVVMFPVDDAADTRTGVNAANELVADADVVGVVGHLGSDVSIVASAVYNDAGIVQISPASTHPRLTDQGFENVFRVCTVDTAQGPFAADFALDELRLDTASVIHDSTPYGKDLATGFAERFEAHEGRVLSRDEIGVGDTDLGVLASRIAGLDPDVIYFGGSHAEGAVVSKQTKAAGAAASLMGGDRLMTQQFIDIVGAAEARGDLATLIGRPLGELPAEEEFREAFTERFPDETIGPYDAYAYDATMVIIEAMKQVAAEMGADALVTPTGKQAVIEAVAEIEYTGVTGRTSFDEKGDTTNEEMTVYVVRDGEWVHYEE